MTGRMLRLRSVLNTSLKFLLQCVKLYQCYYYYYFAMLRSQDLEIQSKPRKRVKIDTVNNQQYNEFKGEAIQIQDVGPKLTYNEDKIEKVDIKGELSHYQKILESIKKNPRSFKKLQQSITGQSVKVEVKKQEQVLKQQKMKEEKQQKKKKEKQKSISSNWKQFLQKSKSQSSHKNQSKQKEKSNTTYEFVAIDCQFVKSGQTDCLARISLVNEHGQQLYDSYVKPSTKITDFVTEVSGITYGHIKNAPNQDHIIGEIKKKMLNKIIIGHTVEKDLQVCGLKNWKGFKKVIDIADTQAYSPGGKRVSLKKLSYNNLGKLIQQGWHSSLEDANATMDLFLKHKQDILKQKNVVKK